MAESSEILALIQQINETSVMAFGGDPIEVGLVTRILSIVVERQYLRLYSAYYIAAWKQAIKDRLKEGLCVAQPLSVTPLQERIPDWITSSDLSKAVNAGSLGYDTLNFFWFRLHRLMIYHTGTNSIFAAKEAKAASPLKHWPEMLPGIGLTCERLAWSYTVTHEGAAKFEFLKPLPEGALYKEIPAGHLKYIRDVEY